MSKRIREVPVSKLKEDIKLLKELDEPLKLIGKKISKLETKVDNTIKCPNCDKYFKEVWVRKIYLAHRFFKGGYFGDEIYESMSRYYTLECPKCKHTWDIKRKDLSCTPSSIQDNYDELEYSYEHTHTMNYKGELIG